MSFFGSDFIAAVIINIDFRYVFGFIVTLLTQIAYLWKE